LVNWDLLLTFVDETGVTHRSMILGVK